MKQEQLDFLNRLKRFDNRKEFSIQRAYQRKAIEWLKDLTPFHRRRKLWEAAKCCFIGIFFPI